MLARNGIHPFLQLAAAFLLIAGVQARTWRSADGAKTFEGELQSYDAASGKVSVTLPNGKQMNFMQEAATRSANRVARETDEAS
jgi:hypothetical protein